MENWENVPKFSTFLLDLDGQFTSGSQNEGNWTITR